MLAAWVIQGNKKEPKSLDALAARYKIPGKESVVSKLIYAGVNPADINPRWLADYCHIDVEVCRQVFLKQQDELSERKQWHLVFVRNLTCVVLSEIEFNGLSLSQERVEEEYKKATAIAEELGAQLAELTGGINLGSPKQLATFLYDVLQFEEATDWKGKPIRTGKGERSAKADTLTQLKPKTDEQRKFMELYKEFNKATSLLEKNLDFFQRVCKERDCKFYGNLQQGVVQTHRLSSSGRPILFKGAKKTKSVQLQNVPREYLKLFWAEEDGWVVGNYDSAQLEFRMAVDMCDDKVGLKEIEEGVDIHAATAKVMTEAGEPTTRQEAKAKTFRPLFGGSSGSQAMQDYCKYFQGHYEGVSNTQRGWALKCADKGQFTTPTGMIFYFPDTKVQRSGYITNTTSIYNYPIQNTSTGEVIPISLVYFWHRTRELPCKIFVTVHDNIACKIREDVVEQVTQIAKRALTTDVYSFMDRVYNYKIVVPLGLGAKISKYWADTKEELSWDVWPDGRERQNKK